jgi:hypothetical protein
MARGSSRIASVLLLACLCEVGIQSPCERQGTEAGKAVKLPRANVTGFAGEIDDGRRALVDVIQRALLYTDAPMTDLQAEHLAHILTPAEGIEGAAQIDEAVLAQAKTFLSAKQVEALEFEASLRSAGP